MDLVEVDIVGAQASEAHIDFGHDRLARQPYTIRSVAHGRAEFGGDHNVFAVRKVLQRPPEDLLAGPI